MHCTACGQENHEGANFCSGCGGAMAASSQSPVIAPDSGQTMTVEADTPPAPQPQRAPVHVAPPTTAQQSTIPSTDSVPHAPPIAAPHYPDPPSQQYADESIRNVAPSYGRQRPPVRLMAIIVAAVLTAVLAAFVFVLLNGGDDEGLPAQSSLDGPAAVIVAGSGATNDVVVTIDFAGSVDNIALYGDGVLVDQAQTLGGDLVWTDAPDGTHSIVLRAQSGEDVLIGEATSVTIGESDESQAETPPATTEAASPQTTEPGAQPTTTVAAPATTEPPATTVPTVGPYVSVFASLPKSSVSLDQANQTGQSLSVEFGLEFHRVIDSDSWASLRDGFWVIASSRDFETIAAAASNCWALGALDANSCFGRPITQNADDLTVVAVPAP